MFGFEETPPPGDADNPVTGDFWAGIAQYWADNWDVMLGKLISIVMIIAIALLIRWVLHFVIERVVKQIVTGVKKKQDVTDTQALQASPLAAVRVVQRTRTLGTVLTNIVNVTLFVVVVLLIVTTINDQILGSFALLTAAVGAGLGFGAQNIVKDALNGLFMVVEDQLGVGDVVDLGPATGIVEEVRIRITTVRDVNGTLWFVRNGEILRVGNMSQGWARVIIDLAVPYDADVETVETELLRTATEMAHSSKWRSRVIEKPEVWGLESISADAMVLRVVMKVRSSAKDDVARELRMRLKHALDAMDLKLPSLTSVVLSGFDGATRVKGAKPPRTSPNRVVPGSEAAIANAAAKKSKNRAPRAPRTAGATIEANPTAKLPTAPKAQAAPPTTPTSKPKPKTPPKTQEPTTPDGDDA